MEIEKKFLIQMPDLEFLKKQYPYTKKEIQQFYLASVDVKYEYRIRKVINDGQTILFLTKKSIESGIQREEEEVAIDEDTFNRLEKFVISQISKTRYTFESEHLYEIDVYNESDENAIMEIEIQNPDENINIIPGVTVVEDVTNDDRYRNRNIAERGYL